MTTSRIFALLLALCMVFSLCACGNETIGDNNDGSQPPAGTDPTADPTDPSNPDNNDAPAVDPNQPITGLSFGYSNLELTQLGGSAMLDVKTEPVGPKYAVSFTSDDPSIATVDSTGKIVAMGKGVCIVTATCGSLTAQCLVTCNIDLTYPEPEPEPEPDPGPSYQESELSFVDYGYGYDATFYLSTGTVQLYDGTIPAEEVQFTSKDKSVATVDATGLVTLLGTGRAIITAKYGKWSIQFIVRVIDG